MCHHVAMSVDFVEEIQSILEAAQKFVFQFASKQKLSPVTCEGVRRHADRFVQRITWSPKVHGIRQGKDETGKEKITIGLVMIGEITKQGKLQLTFGTVVYYAGFPFYGHALLDEVSVRYDREPLSGDDRIGKICEQVRQIILANQDYKGDPGMIPKESVYNA